MSDRDPYHLALSALAGFVGEGRFGWGAPLVTTTLAKELSLSPTPVREALARLAGEGVIEHRPGRGYFAPSPTSGEITELYGLHHRLLRWAMAEPRAPDVVVHMASPASGPARIEQVFCAIVDVVGDAVLARTMRRTTLQLRPIRAVEATLRPMASAEVEALAGFHESSDIPALCDKVEAYHTERVALAVSVIALMRRSYRSIETI